MVRAGRAGGWGSAPCPVCACEQQGESLQQNQKRSTPCAQQQAGADTGGRGPRGPARGARRRGSWMAAPSACFSALLYSWRSHVGISRRPGSHSTTVTLIGAQGNSEGALGASCFSSLLWPTLRFPYSVKCQLTDPRQAFWHGLWVCGRRASLRHTTNSLLMWLDSRKRRNAVHSQLVTSPCYNATPHLLETYLHSSSQAAATQVKINILTCDSCGRF